MPRLAKQRTAGACAFGRRINLAHGAAALIVAGIALGAVSFASAGTTTSARARAAAAAAPVSLTASADTFLRLGAPNTNEGSAQVLRVTALGDNRTLVRFDEDAISTAVGSKTIVSATLSLSITGAVRNWGATGRTIGVYRLTSPWAEGNGFELDAARPRRGTGPGATWNCATDSQISNLLKNCTGQNLWEMGRPARGAVNPWAQPATATALITNGLSGNVDFDVTQDVLAFLSGAADDNGWIVKRDVEGLAGEVRFASREAGSPPTLTLDVENSDTTPPYWVDLIQATDHNEHGGVSAVGWDPVDDQPNPDGSPPSGVAGYRYRYQLNGAQWTAWQTTSSPSFAISGTVGSDVLNVDVVAIDNAGNESTVTSASIAGLIFDNAPTLNLTQPFANPTLTGAQATQAAFVTQNDPTLRQLLAGAPFTIGQAQAWGQDTGAGLVGAQVTVTLPVPVAIEGEWPEATYTGDGTAPYTTANYHLNLTGVTSIDAYVDLASGAIVGLEPDPDAQMLSGTYGPAPLPRVLSAHKLAVAAAASDDLEEDTADSDTGRATDVLRPVCPDNVNCFMNFDFTTKAKDTNDATWDNVDWPVSILWTSNSDIDKVKAIVRSRLSWHFFGSPMAESMGAGNGLPHRVGWTWDTDRGIKRDPCTPGFVKTPHMRLYAPRGPFAPGEGVDYFFSARFGYYVIATVHYDWGECESKLVGVLKSNSWGHAGYSERVEKRIVDAFAALWNDGGDDSVTYDSVPLYNAEHFTKGGHVASSDGIASRISLGLCSLDSKYCP